MLNRGVPSFCLYLIATQRAEKMSHNTKRVAFVPEQIYLLLETAVDILKKEEDIDVDVILYSIEDREENRPDAELARDRMYVDLKGVAMTAVRNLLKYIIEKRLEDKLKRVEQTKGSNCVVEKKKEVEGKKELEE